MFVRFIIVITRLRERIHHLAKLGQRDGAISDESSFTKCKLKSSQRRGGRARFKAHAWNACKLERVSGVRIPPSPPTSLYRLPTIWRWRKRGTHRGAFALRSEPEKSSSVPISRISLGFSPRAEKPGRLRIPAGIRPSIACCGVWSEPLTDPKRRQLRRPLEREIDPIQQGLGA